MHRATSRLLRYWTAYLLAFLVAIAILVWWAALSLPDGRTHLVFFDVGQGDAIFIETPTGQQILIDCGPDPATIASALGREMPFWDRSIDLVVLTHPNEDHLLGLVEVLRRYQVGQVLDSPADSTASSYVEWRRLIAEQNIPYHRGDAGQSLDLGGGDRLEVLSPAHLSSDVNDDSLVLRLSAGSFSALLTGDVGPAAEKELLSATPDLRSLVLKVPHHGGEQALVPGFLEAVAPSTAVISVGRDNRYGHPSPGTLGRLNGLSLYRTDQNGTVVISTDGASYQISSSR
jgi:competence protein ComEC